MTEVAESGSVPTLKVTNKGDAPAFLMAGEQLSGGKQNRVLNASILVAPHSELPIPVSCVERGRWAYRSAKFGSAGSSSHSHLRKLMHSHATLSYRSEGKPSSRQGEVWREVDRKMAETGSHSDTMVLQKMYEDTESDLAPVTEQLQAPEGASGVVFAYGGRIAGFDLFDQPATLAKLWPKLVRAYAVDARAEEEAAPVTRMRRPRLAAHGPRRERGDIQVAGPRRRRAHGRNHAGGRRAGAERPPGSRRGFR